MSPLGVECQRRHGVAACLVRRDHLVGAGRDELALRRLFGRTRDDVEVGTELTCRQRGEDVLGVRVHAGDHPPCALDPRLDQDLVLVGAPLEVQHPHLVDRFAHGGVVLDHNERHAGGAQVTRNLSADATEAADQVVVLDVGDLVLHAARLEQAG
jgi:hypothetical protein